MGSLPSPPPPPPTPDNTAADYRVYASFCPREPMPNTNMSNSIECYDPSTNAWHRIGPIPGLLENHVLKGFGMVAVGDSVYIIGGRLCQKGGRQGSNEIDEVDIEVLPTVRRYNVRTEAWSTCAPLGISRFDFACTVCDQKIYVAGGALASARGISSAEVYDPAVDAWTPLPNMRTLRYKCVGVTWQGKIYVVGGFGESLNVMERSSAEVFDPWNGEWELKVGMWQLDVPPNQIVPVDGKLFSSGDCLNAWKGHIEAYNGKLNIWNVVDGSQGSMIPDQRLYLTMAPIGTHLYFLAGYRIGGELARSTSLVHRFDTSATGDEDPWKSFEPMEEEGEKELCTHCCVVQIT